MYVFDDAYPAPSPRPSRDPPHAPRHPLSLFRPAALVPLAPTSYALPALQSPSKRSARKAAAAAAAAGGSTDVPPYLFGVTALPDSRLRAGGAPPDEPVPKKKRGEDGVRGVPYVRVAFTFNEQEDREEEEELERDGYGTPRGWGAAGSGGLKGKGKGKKKGKKIRPLVRFFSLLRQLALVGEVPSLTMPACRPSRHTRLMERRTTRASCSITRATRRRGTT